MTKTIEQRIEDLERQNRRLKLVGGSTIGLVLLVALLGQATSKNAEQPAWKGRVIEAEAFVVRDRNGLVRAELSVVDGSPGLVMLDTKGKRRITLGMVRHGTSAPTDSPWLAFHNRSGGTPVILSCSDLNRPYMVFRDANGKNRIGLSVWDGVPPYIKMYDEKGATIWQAPKD